MQGDIRNFILRQKSAENHFSANIILDPSWRNQVCALSTAGRCL